MFALDTNFLQPLLMAAVIKKKQQDQRCVRIYMDCCYPVTAYNVMVAVTPSVGDMSKRHV